MKCNYLRLTLAILALPCLNSPAEPTTDGLYAGFDTSFGEFWCRLEYERVPRTVASFVGLASGGKPFIDFPAGRIVQRPFHDGLTFHRTIDKFMIQGGSPNAQGTDGPGYQFADEFHAELRHRQAGILSMANSGPNSNGSQYFITVTNTPWLDGQHSVFGSVVEGLDVVFAISQVPTDDADRPLTPVGIRAVRILRRGPGAAAFDPASVSPALPDVGPVPTALRLTGAKMELLVQPRPAHLLYVLATADFNRWVYGSTKAPLTSIDVGQFLGGPYLSFPNVFLRAFDGGYE